MITDIIIPKRTFDYSISTTIEFLARHNLNSLEIPGFEDYLVQSYELRDIKGNLVLRRELDRSKATIQLTVTSPWIDKEGKGRGFYLELLEWESEEEKFKLNKINYDTWKD